MGALRYNFDLIFANLLFGANFSFAEFNLQMQQNSD